MTRKIERLMKSSGLAVLISGLTLLAISQSAIAGTARSELDRGWELCHNGEFAQARDLAKAGIKSGKNTAAWTELLAYGWYEAPTAALDIAAKADQLNRGDPHIMGTYAFFMSYEPKLLKDALVLSRKAVTLAPQSGRAHAIEATCCWRLGGMNEAASEFEQAINLAPADFDVNVMASNFYELALLDQKAGLAAIGRLAANYPKSSYVWFLNAEFKRRAEDPEGSIRDYGKAIQLKPDYLSAYVGRARINQFMRHFSEAIKDYDVCIRVVKYPGFFAQRAECFENLHQYEKAIADYSEAITITNLPGQNNIYDSKGLKKDDRYRHYWLKRAADYLKEEKYASAISDLSNVLKAEPKCTSALNLRQKAYRKIGKYEDALLDLTALVKVDPTPNCYRDRADVYAKLNRSAESKADEARATDWK